MKCHFFAFWGQLYRNGNFISEARKSAVFCHHACYLRVTSMYYFLFFQGFILLLLIFFFCTVKAYETFLHKVIRVIKWDNVIISYKYVFIFPFSLFSLSLPVLPVLTPPRVVSPQAIRIDLCQRWIRSCYFSLFYFKTFCDFLFLKYKIQSF